MPQIGSNDLTTMNLPECENCVHRSEVVEQNVWTEFEPYEHTVHGDLVFPDACYSCPFNMPKV